MYKPSDTLMILYFISSVLVMFRSTSTGSDGLHRANSDRSGGGGGGPVPWLEVDAILVDETNFDTMQVGTSLRHDMSLSSLPTIITMFLTCHHFIIGECGNSKLFCINFELTLTHTIQLVHGHSYHNLSSM